MADPVKIPRLTRVDLGAVTLKQITDWPTVLIEDYLSINDDSSIVITTVNNIIDAITPLLNLSNSLLVATDSNGDVVSVSDLTSWIIQQSDKRVIVTDNGNGTVTLNLPQDIDTTSTPVFAGLGIGTPTPRKKVDILDTAIQLRLSYTDNAVYVDLECDSTGNLIITPAGDSVKTVSGRIKENLRIVTTPVSIPYNVEVIYGDTDVGNLVGNLQQGINGQHYRFINTGGSGNTFTINRAGTDTINGATSQVLTDGQTLDIDYETTEKWWGIKV